MYLAFFYNLPNLFLVFSGFQHFLALNQFYWSMNGTFSAQAKECQFSFRVCFLPENFENMNHNTSSRCAANYQQLKSNRAEQICRE